MHSNHNKCAQESPSSPTRVLFTFEQPSGGRSHCTIHLEPPTSTIYLCHHRHTSRVKRRVGRVSRWTLLFAQMLRSLRLVRSRRSPRQRDQDPPDQITQLLSGHPKARSQERDFSEEACKPQDHSTSPDRHRHLLSLLLLLETVAVCLEAVIMEDLVERVMVHHLIPQIKIQTDQ